MYIVTVYIDILVRGGKFMNVNAIKIGKVSLTAVFLAAVMLIILTGSPAAAKTHPDGQTVNTTFFYVINDKGQRILVSQIPVSRMETDMARGILDSKLHNYSVLDRYVTTVHQEAQGFTVNEYVKYAQRMSESDALRNVKLTFEDKDKIAFWEMDDKEYSSLDTYTYNDLYGVRRYNFPLLYKYWNYLTQEYYDPDGVLTKEQVVQKIFENGQPEIFLMSVRAFSQRYMIMDEKYNDKDYNLENYFQSKGLLDNERTMRLMVGMTEDELRKASPTASNTRYWVQSTVLDMTKNPEIISLGTVAAPTAKITSDKDNYHVSFNCDTAGAKIYYNQNFASADYMPTMPYNGNEIIIPKSIFTNNTVKITARAVKDGYTDHGVIQFSLNPAVAESQTGVALEADTGIGTPEQNQGVVKNPKNTQIVNPTLSVSGSFADVKRGDWFYDSVMNVVEKKLFNGISDTEFAPSQPMTRAMFVTVLFRMSEDSAQSGKSAFTDVAPGTWYADAVSWAADNNIVKGAGKGIFAPDQSVTREQIAAIMHRYAEYKSYNTSLKDGDNAFNGFSDGASVSPYAADAMKWATSKGIINGIGNNVLSPGSTATRAQVAGIIKNMYDKVIVAA